MLVKKPLALVLLAVAAVAAQASGQTALNPMVRVFTRPQGPVPAECADGVTATQPLLANEVPEPEPEPPPQPLPATPSVPPSNELRTTLRRAQVAAEGEDYGAFKAAVAGVRDAVESYPPGGERNAANDALLVYADVALVWDYAMASPTGSFFDNTAQGGSLLNALKRYPDYGRAIAEETVTAGGTTLYPTRETRHFLAQESARRVARLGVSVPPRVPAMTQMERPRSAATPPPVKQAAATPPKKQTKPKSAPKTAEVRAAPKPHTAKHTPARTAKASSPKPATPRIKSTPVPTPKSEKPAPTKIAATSTVAPAPPPAASTNTGASSLPIPTTPIVATPPQPSTTTAATTSATISATNGPAIDTAATGTTTSIATTASSTDTTATAAPDTATTGTAVPAQKQNGNMNLLLAIVLILVGIGVLVVLFRASD
ncbi:MAG: hypothetical protein M3P29_08660 [Acidobacteriota bacterium]|nr:hypothetical protein [Acidobacteriota bacterium]